MHNHTTVSHLAVPFQKTLSRWILLALGGGAELLTLGQLGAHADGVDMLDGVEQINNGPVGANSDFPAAKP